MISTDASLDPASPVEIATLAGLLELSDHSRAARRHLLRRLAFTAGSRPLAELGSTALEDLEPYITPQLIAASVLLVAIFAGIPGAVLVLSLTGGLVASYRWVKAQRDRNVDDAMRRKDRANQLIIQSPRLLFPYVGNVFDSQLMPWAGPRELEEQIRAEMFVFAEIDNLEFVFDKSRSGLMDTEYALRAIKIFVARAENDRFERLARTLLVSGRYNSMFAAAAQRLLCLGGWVGRSLPALAS